MHATSARHSLMDRDDDLTGGILGPRLAAWAIDACVLAIVVSALWVALFLFGVLTFGLGFSLLGVLPFVPVAYGAMSIASPLSATPGQRLMGLAVRRNDDLGPPDIAQALATTILFYVTWWGSLLLQFVAILPVAARRRMLHDVLSGTVVVRAGALTSGPFDSNMTAHATTTHDRPTGDWHRAGDWPRR